ncbi:MAG: diheme cytochrome c, partial [Pseudomonadota bacterium]
PNEARGDSGDDLMPRLTHQAWQQECGSCHLAYPPALLPKASWQRLMAGLDDHFGENASLDPATRADILRFLEAHAADSGISRMGGKVMQRMDTKTVPLRITETTWFVRKHDEVPASAWRRKSVGSAANCAACHRQAEKGHYDDDTVRIPR